MKMDRKIKAVAIIRMLGSSGSPVPFLSTEGKLEASSINFPISTNHGEGNEPGETVL